MTVLEISEVRLWDQARASIFTCQKFISLKTVVHIRLEKNCVFPKEIIKRGVKYPTAEGNSCILLIDKETLKVSKTYKGRLEASSSFTVRLPKLQ